MSKTKHKIKPAPTGGEWAAVKALNQMAFPATTVCVINYQGKPITSWYVKTTAHAHGSEEATAKLIAAAPDLLQALCFCKSVIENSGMFERSEQMAVAMADEAIKKTI